MPSISKPPEPGSRAPAAPRPLPPADVPPPGTDAGCVVLLDVLRRRVEGFPTWMLPRYVLHDADVYSYHPEELLQVHPSATSPDGKRAWYFLNLVRPKSATDQRRKRTVPGGTWKSEQAPAPVEAAPGKMVGSKQHFSFISDEEGGRGGYIMHEFVLPAQAGRLAGGDELALSKVFPTPRVDKKRKRSIPRAASSSPLLPGSATRTGTAPSAHLLPGSATRTGASSSPPLLPGSATRTGASSSPPLLPGSARRTGASSSPPLLPGSARRTGAAPSAHLLPGSATRTSPPPLQQAPASTPAPQGPAASSASSLAPQGPAASSASSPVLQGPPSSAPSLRQVLATAPRPPSSAPPLRQGPGTAAPPSSPSLRQGPAKRVLFLEVGDSPPREGKSFSCQPVYKAMEVLRSGRRVPIDCIDMFVLDSGRSRRQQTAAEF